MFALDVGLSMIVKIRSNHHFNNFIHIMLSHLHDVCRRNSVWLQIFTGALSSIFLPLLVSQPISLKPTYLGPFFSHSTANLPVAS